MAGDKPSMPGKRELVSLAVLVLALSAQIQPTDAAVGGNCTTDPSICASGSEICNANTCQCAAGYITDSAVCKLPGHGEQCQTSPGCGPSLQCDAATKTCQCGTDQYYGSSRCENNSGAACAVNAQCRSTLSCLSNKCGCTPDQFFNSSQHKCQTRKDFGADCAGNTQCRSTLGCLSNKCGCTSDKFFDSSQHKCQTKIAYSQLCNSAQSSNNVCAEANTVCIAAKDNTNRCLCGQDYYRTDGGACNHLNSLRVTSVRTTRETARIVFNWNSGNPGRNDVTYTVMYNNGVAKANQTGGTVSGLTPGTQYNFQIISSLPAGTYYSEKFAIEPVNGIWTKFSYSQQCNITQATNVVCDETNTACVDDPDNSKRCLCSQNYYRPTSGSCMSLTSLRVTSVNPTTETTRIVFNWNSGNPRRNDVTYTIKYNNREVPANQTGGTVSGLTPGTQYSFQIISSLAADTYYSEKSAPPLSVNDWTKPAKPGTVGTPVRSSQPNETYFIYQVTFQGSTGNVAKYTLSVTGNEAATIPGGRTSQPIQVYLYKLVPDRTYSYILTAYNGNFPQDPSEPVRSTFKTGSKGPGPVQFLNVTTITEDSAVITWTTPRSPNGNITGYRVEVTQNNRCLYVMRETCPDCVHGQIISTPSSCSVNEHKQYSFAQLNNASTTYKPTLPQLKPYTLYTVSVLAEDEEGPGTPQQTSLTTQVAAANAVQKIEMSSTLSGRMIILRITWSPGEFTGPTSYDVSVSEEKNLNSGEFVIVKTANIPGYTNTSYTLNNVLAYWNYQVTVVAKTSKGSNSKTPPERTRTAANVPGLVQYLSVKQDDSVAQELVITFGCPEEKQRNGIITHYVIQKTLLGADGENDQTSNMTVLAHSSDCILHYSAINVGGILVGRNYTFAVRARNNMFIGSLSSSKFLYVAPKRPLLTHTLSTFNVSNIVTKPAKSRQHEHKVEITLCAACLLDGSQGPPTQVGLVVCVKHKETSCGQFGRKKRSLDDYRNLPTWGQAKIGGFLQPYRTTPDNWMSNLNNTRALLYTVGADSSCSSDNATTYCNGPVPGDKEISISVFVCNSVGCDMENSDVVFQTEVPSDNSSLVLGLGIGLGCAALVGVVVVVVVVVWHRKRTKSKPCCGKKDTSYSGIAPDQRDFHPYEEVNTGGNSKQCQYVNQGLEQGQERAGENTNVYNNDVNEPTVSSHEMNVYNNMEGNGTATASQAQQQTEEEGLYETAIEMKAIDEQPNTYSNIGHHQ